MATVLQKLRDDGWFIGEEGLKKISENGTVTDVKELVKRALDVDLRELVVNGGLGTDFGKGGKLEIPASGLVLQVLNIRNVSAPKANQESKASPRLLQLDLTDGQTLCSGLEMEHISAISLNTAPGTKVMIKNPIKLVQGMILFGPQNIHVIGGRVEVLYEKWEINRTLAKYAQGGRRPNNDGNGPPPWIPFGQKIESSTSNDKAFKSLGAAGGDKSKDPSKENSEFIATRNEAIAEATKIATKKVFGGGNRQLMDHNVKKILDKGYSEEQAKHALKLARNNLERAMNSLKRQGNQDTDDRHSAEPKAHVRHVSTRDDRPMGGRRAAKAEAAEMAAAAKPTGQVSLFDFLEDKIKLPASVQELPLSSSATSANVDHSHGGSMKSGGGKQGSNNISHNNYKQNNAIPSNARYNPRGGDNHPSNSDNRSKFENNISSSFASRQRKDDNAPYQKTTNYNSARPNIAKWNNDGSAGGGGPSQNSGYTKKPSYPPYSGQQQQHQPQSQHMQSAPPPHRNNNYDGNKFHSNPKYHANGNQPHQASHSNSNYYQNYQHQQPNNNGGANRYGGGGPKNTGHDNHQYSDTNNKGNSAPPHRNINDRKTPNAISKSGKPNINELVDATISLKIGANTAKVQQQSSQSQQQHSSAGMHNHNKNSFEEVFPQAPKGFAYNPYKIMGFQNKETNEFAMNVLKTQVIDQSQVPQTIHIPKQVAAAAQPPPPPPPTIHAETYVPMHQQPPPTIHHIYNGPPPQMAHTMPNFIVATGAGIPANMPTPMAQQAPFQWDWRVGDRCIAKYWEDGHYYNAEISGVTDKTCVVHFLEYGNYEEVVLSDCLPITDANNQTVNHYNNGNLTQPQQAATPQQVHYQMPHSVQAPAPHHYQQQQQQHRFRNDRKMYVPPAQRK